MIEEFLANLANASMDIVPIVIMTVALAAFVGWIEKSNSPRLQEQPVKKEKRNEK